MEDCVLFENALLSAPFSCIINGRSGLGKTHFLKNMFLNWNRHFSENVGEKIAKFSLYYKSYQDVYEEILSSLPKNCIINLNKELPLDLTELTNGFDKKSGKYHAIVFDDWQTQIEENKCLLKIFLNLIRVNCRHNNIILCVSFKFYIGKIVAKMFSAPLARHVGKIHENGR